MKRERRRWRGAAMGLLTALVLGTSLTACAADKRDRVNEAGQEGRTAALGQYCPDTPAPWEISQDEEMERLKREGQKEIDAIGKQDMELMNELREGYRELTLTEFRGRLEAQTAKSETLILSVSEITHAAMYSPWIDLDEFYTSLYFALQDYYMHSGNESLADSTYYFIYNRYFGETNGTATQEAYDVLKEVVFGYDVAFTYGDEAGITVAKRDAAVAAAVGEVNAYLDKLSLAQWNKIAYRELEAAVGEILKMHSTNEIAFELVHTSGNRGLEKPE